MAKKVLNSSTLDFISINIQGLLTEMAAIGKLATGLHHRHTQMEEMSSLILTKLQNLQQVPYTVLVIQLYINYFVIFTNVLQYAIKSVSR